MQLKTLFGGVIGIAIAFPIGPILIHRLHHVYRTELPQAVPFLLFLTAIGGFTGGAIASPVVEVGDE